MPAPTPSPHVPIASGPRPLRVGIVANEPSGDQLGAGLIQGIRAMRPDARFEGVGGPRMLAEGVRGLVPMERLSVMGLVEVLRHLPELLRIRRDPPDLFIGVDAPDFNLPLEARLRAAGIPAVHYVSPTVWAWRPGRVHDIRRSVDLMLSIFPFELEFLRQHGVPARYVGHPLAETIPLDPDRGGARVGLGLPADATVVALLPGSRLGEVEALAPVFLQAASWCLQRRPGLRFVSPLVNGAVRGRFEHWLAVTAPDLPITLVDGRSWEVLAAADLVITASGTATLEALLHQRPMVVGYRLNPLTYWIVRTFNLVKVRHVAMANLLAGEELAPELLQDACRPDRVGGHVLALLDDAPRLDRIRARYRRIHQELRMDSRRAAAQAVLDLLGPGGAES